MVNTQTNQEKKITSKLIDAVELLIDNEYLNITEGAQIIKNIIINHKINNNIIKYG